MTPESILRCKTCYALLLNDWDEKSHMEWHRKVKMKTAAELWMEEAQEEEELPGLNPETHCQISGIELTKDRAHQDDIRRS